MATRFSQDIKTNIQELTLESVQSLYEWITYCVREYNKKALPKVEIRYKRGDISCSTDNYQEFIRDTYGLTIIVGNMHISYYDIDLSFSINTTLRVDSRPYQRYVEITIYSKDINSILAIVPSLKDIINRGRVKAPEQFQQLPEITVNVGGNFTMANGAIGNGNMINNSGTIIATSKSDVKEDPTKKSFWRGILQQIIANWIWWLLGLIAVTCAVCWGIVSI